MSKCDCHSSRTSSVCSVAADTVESLFIVPALIVARSTALARHWSVFAVPVVSCAEESHRAVRNFCIYHPRDVLKDIHSFSTLNLMQFSNALSNFPHKQMRVMNLAHQ